jgi:hypothetical protein
MTNKLPKIGKKKLQVITTIEYFESFVNRSDIDIIQVDVKGADNTYMTQQGFIAVIYYKEITDHISQEGKKVEQQERIMKQHEQSGKFGGDKIEELKEEVAIKSNIIGSYKRSSLICTCGNKQESVYPAFTQINNIQCGKCLRSGHLQLQNENAKIDSSFWERRVCKNCNKKLGVNALANSKGEGLFCSYDCSEPKKSVWKPVSEFEGYNVQVILKESWSKHLIFGVVKGRKLFYGVDSDHFAILGDNDQVATLTDFINQQEELQVRVEKLEKLLEINNE